MSKGKSTVKECRCSMENQSKDKRPYRKPWEEERKSQRGKGRSAICALPRWLLTLVVRIRERMKGGTETELAWTKWRKEKALLW